ncbi:MAG TPA: diacylglycerol kinase family protein [Jatrophihabitantaceae bacterium]|jgi:YegS/Rv2252/BmrU family lipid kinase|nr:diacylglycerol kinase family protein [Jatrophihabitantaceae bacterium]
MRSFTALVNPVSGGGTAALKWAPLAARLQHAGAEVSVVLTLSQAHAVEAAEQAAADGHVVVAVGGDGLVRDVATGVVAADGMMAIVPAGRGNDLAAALGLPTGHAELADLLLHSPGRAIDVLEVNGTIVPGNVYAGLDAVATKIINNNRRVPAKLLYRLAPVLALARWKPATFTVRSDTGTMTGAGHMVVIANSGRYGHGLHIVPSAVLDDGMLHTMLIGAVPKYKVAAFMSETKHGTHAGRPEVQVSTATQVTLSADRPVPVCADGDELGMLPVTVTLRAASLRILAPPPA